MVYSESKVTADREVKSLTALRKLKGKSSVKGIIIKDMEIDESVFAAISQIPNLQRIEFRHCENIGEDAGEITGENVWTPINYFFPQSLNTLSFFNMEKIPPEWIRAFNGQNFETLKMEKITSLDKSAMEGIALLKACLKNIRVHQIELDGEFFQLLQEFKKLEQMELRSFSNDKDVFEGIDFGNWRNLKTLTINYGPIEYLPKGIEDLEMLKHLDLSHLNLNALDRGKNDMRPGMANRISKLEVLKLDANNISKMPYVVASQLKILTLSQTPVKTVPTAYLTECLEVLDLSYTDIKTFKTKRMEALKHLDLSYTELSELPKNFEAPELQVLELEGIKGLTRLPDWIGKKYGQERKLKRLGLSWLKLEYFPFALLDGQFEFKDGISPKGKDRENKGEACQVYIGGLQVDQFNVQYLLANDAAFFKKYTEQVSQSGVAGKTEGVPLHRGNIILLGDMGAGKTQLMRRLFDEDIDSMRAMTGFLVQDDPAAFQNLMFENRNSTVPNNDAEVRVIELSGCVSMQLGHPLVMQPGALYLVVLDAERSDLLHQRAKYWSYLVEMYAPHSKIMYIVNNVKEHDVFLNTSLLENVVFSDIVPKVFYLSDDNAAYEEETVTTDDITELKKKIVEEICSLNNYNQILPYDWKMAIRHTETLVEARTGIPQKTYAEICEFYHLTGIENSFLEYIISKLGRIFVDENKDAEKGYMIYDASWLESGIFHIFDYAQSRNGRLGTMQEIWTYLIDNARYSYSKPQVETLVAYMEKYFLIYKEGIAYYCTAFMGKRNKTVELYEKIRLSPDTLHYVIECPVLTQGMMTELITRLICNAEKPGTVQKYEAGCESLFISFFTEKRFLDGGAIFLMGNVGAETSIHLYVAPFNSDKTRKKPAKIDMRKHVQMVLEQWLQMVEAMPQCLQERYKLSIELILGENVDSQYSKRDRISISEIMAYDEAGRNEYFSGGLSTAYMVRDIIDKYTPKEFKKRLSGEKRCF